MTSDAATETVSVSEPIARRLALRLIVGIVAFSTLVAVLVSGAQIWIEYDRDITSLRGRFELVRESYLESVTENAWLADTARLRTLLAGIGRLPDIVQANVRLTNGPTVDVGTPPLNQAVERLDLPLRRLYRGREVEIGTFTVIASLEGPRQRLLDRALFIIVGNGIKTCLVILFALFLIRRLVTHRLETITRHVRDIAVSGYGGGRLAESDFAAGAEDDEIALLGRQYNAALAALETDRRKLAEKERQIRGLIVATPFALAVTDAESGEILFANEAQARLIGATPETARGRSFSDSYLRPEDRKEWLALLERDGQIRDFEFPIRRADGAVAWISLSATRIQFEGRDAILGAFYDVTDRRKAQYQLRLAETAFANALEAIMVTDADGTIVSVNRAFTDITGYTAEEAIGRTPRLLRSDRQDADFYRAFWRELKTRGTHSGEIWNRRKNGEAYIQHQAITAIRDERGNIVNYVSVMSDLTERRRSDERLRDVVGRDPLTGLPNRAQLFDRLGQMCKVIDAEGGRGAVIHIDIDRFRLVNASAGPQIGDALLQAAAEALAATLGSGDTLARSGSDEFVAVLADIATEREAAARAEGFARALAKPMRIEGHDYRLTVSQGIALTPDDGRDAATLLRVAGIAVAQAKATGGNAYRFHDSRAEATAKSRLDLEEGLRAALDRGGFELHYQPKLHLDGGGVVGVEALIRWRRGGALVSPAEFIPIAEETGLIVPIGAWVLREACLQGALWAKDGLGRIPIAVNVSARQLREEGFFATVREAVAASGFSPRLIEIEVTESLIMENPDEAREVLGRLRGLGLRVSIDDFGTGYSSLAVMGRLPVDTVKIDRSFVANLDRGEGAAAIVRTVVALADNLALDVVAEGVETEAQAAALKACGCPVAQGYLFARPMPPAAATAWLRQKLTRQDAEGA